MSQLPDRPVGEVWAPRARRVEVVVGEQRRPTDEVADGWFRPVEPLRPGDRYAFSLDGGPPRADPRSHWQPDGLGAPSAVVDHDRFHWADGAWPGRPLPGSVLYELHVGTFTREGTFDAAAARLPLLVELGITTIELMPVAQLPGRWGWGYDGVLLYATDAGYGGPEGLKRLVDAAHAHGLAVLLDVVYNHFGPEDCYLGEFGPYTNDAAGTPWGGSVNLDGSGSAGVREHLLANAAHWLTRFHLDGLRLDATHAFVDRTAIPFLEHLATTVASVAAATRRAIVLVAENDRNDPRLTQPWEAGGSGLDGQWSDDQHHALHALLTGERGGYYARYGGPEDLVKALEDVFVDDGRFVRDGRAPRGRAAGDAPRHRFVVSAQNHDQVGNRPSGERLSHLAGPDAAGVAAAVTLLGSATPLLFQGEEWAATSPFPFFTDFRDPALSEAVREGRLRELGDLIRDGGTSLDPVAEATRDLAVLRWDERNAGPHARVLDWYRTLLRLRREHPELADPDPHATTAGLQADGRVLSMNRGRVAVVVNLSDTAAPAIVPDGRPLAAWPDASTEGEAHGAGDSVLLPPYGVRIVQRTTASPSEPLGPSGGASAGAIRRR